MNRNNLFQKAFPAYCANTAERTWRNGNHRVRPILHIAIRRTAFFFLRPWDGVEIPKCRQREGSGSGEMKRRSGGFLQSSVYREGPAGMISALIRFNHPERHRAKDSGILHSLLLESGSGNPGVH
ncbi:MAG: hypothetical protein C4527_18480 [Candidatus Omnitrophota bacterium]|jgi:hypothetical protein|nr:MAG: hypothetical protein C4527_18480 [Candidatus Omnitrophota bacterium]